MLKVGEEISGWKIKQKISMKYNRQVFKATHVNDKKVCILKEFVLPSETSEENNRLSFIEDKISQLKKFDHPGIAKVYDYFITQDSIVIVTEYIDGINLNQYVNNNGPLSETKAITLMKSLAESLQYIHDRGLIHFDVKPSNIILRKGGGVALIDFDASGKVGAIETMYKYGTEFFTAPERKLNLPNDSRSDIYSFGITMYYLLTETLPGIGSIIIPIHSANRNISKDVANLITKCINAEPQNRYQSCQDIVNELSIIEIRTHKKRIISLIKNMAICAFVIAITALLLIKHSMILSFLLTTMRFFIKSIITNKAMIVSLALLALINTIKILVRQHDSLLEKLYSSLIELPIDILIISAGYIGNLFVPTTDHFTVFIFFIILLIAIIVVCYLCYCFEYMIISGNTYRISYVLGLFFAYFMSLYFLTYVSSYG